MPAPTIQPDAPADLPADFRTDPARALEMIQGRSPGERRRETLWQYLGQPLMHRTLEGWYGLRRALLRLFGATLHPTARISRKVKIHHPWNLTMDEGSAVANRAILFCLGPIRIGRGCHVSQFAHLCAGSHDYTRPDMPLIADPITLEEEVWVAADAFIGPGVTIGRGTIIGARTTVLHSRPAGLVCVGDSARTLHARTPGPAGDPPAPAGVSDP